MNIKFVHPLDKFILECQVDSVGCLILATRATAQHHHVKDRLVVRCKYEEKKIWCRRSDAAARFRKDNYVAVAVHCCAYSLNLCFKILKDGYHIFKMFLKELKK